MVMSVVKKVPYWAFSVSIFIAWIVVLLFTWKIKGDDQLKDVFFVFCGYFLGSLAATIARKIYK